MPNVQSIVSNWDLTAVTKSDINGISSSIEFNSIF